MTSTLSDRQLDLITALRKNLNAIAEISGEEVRTKKALLDFLSAHTSLELHEEEKWFYGVHREENTTKDSIAIRADFDAVASPDGSPRHLCGHDGHSAALCALGLLLEGETVGRTVILLFQHGEETGEGAPLCCDLFQKETVGEIFGAHNLPGFPFGEITTKTGTFSCASRGITLTFKGTPTHAAYPEHGISPAITVGKLLCALPELSDPAKYHAMTLCTVIGTKMGEKAFGMAASTADIWLTLRGEEDEDLEKLEKSILAYSESLAFEHKLIFSYDIQDAFPATRNHETSAQKVLSLCEGKILPEPMRWSEDFGWYLQQCKGAFFGIGAGKAHPPLHTAEYEYPDALLAVTAKAFANLILGA